MATLVRGLYSDVDGGQVRSTVDVESTRVFFFSFLFFSSLYISIAILTVQLVPGEEKAWGFAGRVTSGRLTHLLRVAFFYLSPPSKNKRLLSQM